jgi:hypothetical protein
MPPIQPKTGMSADSKAKGVTGTHQQRPLLATVTVLTGVTASMN